jgi:hypothetical protein
LDHDAQVAATATLHLRNALAANDEFAVRLSTSRNIDVFDRAIELGEGKGGSESGLREGNRESGDQVVARALETWVRADTQMHVQITGIAAARTDRTPAGQPQGRAMIDSGGDLDRVGLFADGAAIASAGGTRGDDDLAESAALRASRCGDHLAEQALADPTDLPLAVALRAGDRLCALTRAGPGTGRAARCRAHRHRHLGPKHRLFEGEVGHDFEILTSRRASRTTAALPTPEGAAVPEERIEDIAEAATAEVARPTAGATHTLIAETVVAGALIAVGEHLIGPGEFLELLLRLRVVRVGVGMQLPGALAIRLLDFITGRRAIDAEQFVKVSHQGLWSLRFLRGAGRVGR